MKAFDGNGMVPVYKVLREFISVNYNVMLRFCLSNPYIATVDAGAKYISEYSADMAAARGGAMSPGEIEDLKAEADKVSKHMPRVHALRGEI